MRERERERDGQATRDVYQREEIEDRKRETRGEDRLCFVITYLFLASLYLKHVPSYHSCLYFCDTNSSDWQTVFILRCPGIKCD